MRSCYPLCIRSAKLVKKYVIANYFDDFFACRPIIIIFFAVLPQVCWLCPYILLLCVGRYHTLFRR